MEMPGAGMASRVETETPRCRKAWEELNQVMARLRERIEAAEERFSSVLADEPPTVGPKEKGLEAIRPREMLADEIFRAVGVVGHAADRVQSLVERCEL